MLGLRALMLRRHAFVISLSTRSGRCSICLQFFSHFIPTILAIQVSFYLEHLFFLLLRHNSIEKKENPPSILNMTVHESSNYPELIRKSQSPEDTHQVLMCETREGAGEGEIGDYPVRLEDDHTLSGSQQCTWPPGCRPYLCLVGCFFLMFNSYGLINAYGSFVSYYKDHLLAGRDALLYNLIGTTQSFLVLFPSAIIGRVLDAGYVKVLTGGGTTLVSLGLFSLSVVNGKGADKDAGAGQGSYGLIWLMQALILGLGMTCFVVTSSYSKRNPADTDSPSINRN